MADITDKNWQRLFRLGFFFYLAYAVLAVIYFRERSSFLDIPFHIFEMTYREGPAIQNYRFVSLLTQWAPVLAIKMGLSLKAIMVIYSLVFALLYGTVYWLCGLMRQYGIGLAWLLTLTLFSTHTFFWMQSELPQGMAVFFLSLAVIFWRPEGKTGAILHPQLLLVSLVTLAFAHPLLAAPFLAALAMFWFYHREKDQRRWLLIAAIIYLIAYATRAVFFPTNYDSGAMEPLRDAGNSIKHFWSMPVARFMLRKWVGAYALMPLALIFLGWLYVRKNISAWQWLFLFGGFMAYLLVIVLGDIYETTAPFYRENLLWPLGIFIAIPFVLYGIPFLIEKRWGIRVLWIIMIGAIARFVVVGFQYQERYRWLNSFVQQHQHEKLIIADKPEYVDALIMTWSTPYESWLVSTANTGKTASLIIYENPQELEWATHNPQTFLTRWGAFPYSNLSRRYFHFTDTVSTYRIVP